MRNKLTCLVILLLPFLTGCAAIFKAMGVDAETAEQAGPVGETIAASVATGSWIAAGLGVITLGGILFASKDKKKGK